MKTKIGVLCQVELLITKEHYELESVIEGSIAFDPIADEKNG